MSASPTLRVLVWPTSSAADNYHMVNSGANYYIEGDRVVVACGAIRAQHAGVLAGLSIGYDFHDVAGTHGDVTINLQDRQPVDFRVINVLGKKIIEKRIDLALNQTIGFDLVGYQNGVYLIQVEGPTFRKTARVVLDK